MDEWLNQIWKKGKNPYIRALGLFVFSLFALLGVVSLLSDTGFSQEVQNYRNLAWILCTGIALLIATFWLISDLRQRKGKVFFRNTENGNLYLKVPNGKFREIPDKDTFTFLANIFGVDDTMEISPTELDKLYGERIVSVEDWETPPTPEEQIKKNLHRQVRSAIQKTKSYFDEGVDPQRIVVRICNNGDTTLYVRKIKFQPHDLPNKALLPHHSQISAAYFDIPVDENDAILTSGKELEIELKLGQKWRKSDIELMKGKWGFIIFDFMRNGELVDSILLTV